MPHYYQCVDPNFTIYCGEDKFENEGLIRWGWPEDVFFHVDELSSAHIYLRCPFVIDLKKLESKKDILRHYAIPEEVLEQCCQLTKYNSIQGNKQDSVEVIFTPWENLRKDQDMAVGTIGFHNYNIVDKRKTQKNKAIVKQLIKTKEVRENVDLEHERTQRDKKEKLRKKREARHAKKAEKKAKEVAKEQRRQEREEQEQKSYDRLFDDSAMVTNTNMNMSAQEYEDSFM